MDNAIEPKQSSNAIEALESLTPQNRVFLQLLLEGKKVFDAYKQSGYDGEYHAAYMLKSRLDRELSLMAQSRNMSKADLLIQLGSITELPLIDKNGNKPEGISIPNKLRALALMQKALNDDKPEAPKLTFIQINKASKPEGSKPIDASAVIDVKAEVKDVIPGA